MIWNKVNGNMDTFFKIEQTSSYEAFGVATGNVNSWVHSLDLFSYPSYNEL